MPDQNASVVWFEIRVTDLQKAADFYYRAFGWEFEPFEEYDKHYWVLRGKAGPIGGALVLCRPDSGMKCGSVVFMRVPNLHSHVALVQSISGVIEQSPKSITPNAGSFALVRDPDGNCLGLWCPETL
jgi:uncharacterized protein